MSVSPAQNSLKPSPVPGPSTVTDTSGAMSSNSSATRIEIGSTVDEPEMNTEPATLAAAVSSATEASGSSSPPQAAATSENVIMIASSQRSRCLELCT